MSEVIYTSERWWKTGLVPVAAAGSENDGVVVQEMDEDKNSESSDKREEKWSLKRLKKTILEL